jgi:hypothetical protein
MLRIAVFPAEPLGGLRFTGYGYFRKHRTELAILFARADAVMTSCPVGKHR